MLKIFFVCKELGIVIYVVDKDWIDILNYSLYIGIYW